MDYAAQYHPQPPAASQSADSAPTQPYDPSTYHTQYQYQYQQQPPADPSQIQSSAAHTQYQYPQQGQLSQSADGSQTQAYDPSYYAYQDYNQQHYQQYSYYPSQDYYSNAAYQQQQQQPEPTSIYPPGVPIPPSSSDPYATQPQQQQPQYSYYPPQQQQQGINYAEAATVSVPNVLHTPAIVQSPYRGRGKRGGKPYRGGGHGHLGGGQPQPSHALPTYAGNQPTQGGPSVVKPSSAASGNSATVQPPPRMVWCEICRVGCNTHEVLEVHRSGKKHKKNLKAYEERQKLNKLMDGGPSVQTSTSEFIGQLPKEHLPSEFLTGDKQLQPVENVSSHVVIDKDGSITGKQKVEEAAPVEELAKGQGRGLKRTLRGGRTGKMMKSGNGSKKPAVPSKPKKMVPLICELCNVTCESVVVFQSHLAGKKHLSNLKDFQDQQAVVGQAALQALYPALQALYPALQALCQPNTGASASVAPQSNQHNLHEILGLLAQQALSTIPQHPALGIGTAATSALPPPPSDLEDAKENAAAEDGRKSDHPVLQNTGCKPEENEEPLRFVTRGDVPSTSGAVIAAVSVSNSEVTSSDSAAHSRLDGKVVN